MSLENIEKIVHHELAGRRRARFHLAGFSLAVLIVLAALFTAM